MREHEINKLNNFISGYYFDDLSICNDLIEYHSTAADRRQGTVSGGEIDKTAKDSIDCAIRLVPDEMRNKYHSYLKEAIGLYLQRYEWAGKYSAFSDFESGNIQHYAPGGGYFEWHTERTTNVAPFSWRHLVFMTFLNDVTDGGETEFYYQKVKVKPEKGLTLIWGSDWTFTHRGIPSLSQDKYIATGWMSFVE